MEESALRNPEATNQQHPIRIPPHWTTLYHGSNLSRNQWGSRLHTLDKPTLTVSGLGLSTISQEDKDANKERAERMGAPNAYDTTRNYSLNVTSEKPDRPLEIRVVFPSFHSRRRGSDDMLKLYSQKYGVERAKAILALSDAVHWRNAQQGRHPLLPKGMILRKLGDEVNGNSRVITYVPEVIDDIYLQENQDDISHQ